MTSASPVNDFEGDVEKPAKQQKMKKAASGRPSPEEIAELRRERAAKKIKMEEVRKQQHVPEVNAHGYPTAFIKRPLTPLPHVSNASSKANRFTLMTYNVLAQSLVRRKLFPTSGEALKWKNRQDVLVNELRHYSPTLMALQEVGTDMLESRLDQYLKDRDYNYEYHSGRGKKHGLVIAFDKKRFVLVHAARIFYDDSEANQKAKYPSRTNNVGLCCALREKNSGTVLTIGTCHLWWHPRGTCERARQIAMLRKFVLDVDAEHGQGNVILAGDFNTEPIDPSYKSLTERPFELDEQGRAILEESSLYKALKDTEGEDEEDADSAAEEQGGPASEEENDVRPSWQSTLDELSSGPQLFSMYGQHYHLIDPDNLHQPSREPACTNYANVYRGTLDYILTRSQKGSSERLPLTALLKMPDTKLLDRGQPQAGEFPSDHFCLMAEFAIEK